MTKTIDKLAEFIFANGERTATLTLVLTDEGYAVRDRHAGIVHETENSRREGAQHYIKALAKVYRAFGYAPIATYCHESAFPCDECLEVLR